jgi:excisionase family DNA binding protein
MANGLQIVERRAFSIVEAAQMYGVSRATVYKLIEQNKLETVKIGSRRLVPLPAIDALLSAGAQISSAA